MGKKKQIKKTLKRAKKRRASPATRGTARADTKRTKERRRAVGNGAAARAGANSVDGDVSWLTIVGAKHNNLHDLTVEFPLARFVCITGVSGSGKSSLVNDILSKTLARDLNGAVKVEPGAHDRIEGMDQLDKVIDIDQSPIGRTPRSNPATYIKVFDEIRALFTKLPDAKVRGYKPGRFSFNVHTGRAGGGRCESCEGNGQNKMEMDFLADVWIACPVCNGHRFSRETLQILYKGKSIADVLGMDVQEALDHFANVPKIARMLTTLHDVGLDYIKLGQSSTTLSGGEAQRIKLARELVKQATGRTMYVLDEPTTGLHFDDIKKLLSVLHRFVDDGNTVVVIEHNLDVIKTADWVIDLGPEGGARGGRIVAQGTPELIAKSKRSYTGQALRELFDERAKRLSNRSARKASRGGKKKSASTKTAKRKRSSVGDITVVGAKQHNLKDVTVTIPRGKMTVCSGPSGSGKSSLAIDTLYTEGQRRYVESLSAYARQFLSRLAPPKVDHVYGLSPSICIEQKTTSKSPRSTVGTITEIYDYMRVLWARIGVPHCPKCRIPIGTQSSDEIVEKVLSLGDGVRVMLMAPIELTGQESYAQRFGHERANGYARVRVDGAIHKLDDEIEIDAKRRHAVELVIDRLVARRRNIARITDSVEQALSVGQGVMMATVVGDDESQVAEHRFSQHRSCEQCGTAFDELTPHHFSFNSRMGWCEACDGLGVQQGASASAVVIHPTLSLLDGAIAGWDALEDNAPMHAMVSALAKHIGFDVDTPWNDLTETHRLAVLYGTGDAWIQALPQRPKTSARKAKTGRAKTKRRTSADLSSWGALRFRWRGFFPAINRATRTSWQYRKRLEDLATEVPCDACAGGRLRPESASACVQDSTIQQVCGLPLAKALSWFEGAKFTSRDRKIAGELLHEITSRLRFLVDVGLDYVSIHRSAATLSGGESQRIQLASQIGTGLTGVLYVLDEPTIGLHPRDNTRLIGALRRLRNLGNTLLLVEHDREVIESADHLLDFGPGAGADGGQITASASPKRIRTKRDSLTGKYLSGKEAIPVPSNRRAVTDDTPTLTIHGAREHNLREVDVSFPLGRFTCVTGVSGSGKSTLVSSILYNALATRIHRARLVPGGHDRISGVERIDKVINVDQSPIGNSPTSNPATYTGLFDTIRSLYARLPDSKIRGYGPNRYSFNRPGGRCESCEGMGQRCIEMHFLPDVWIECESCKGLRYVAETLDVRYRGKNIAEVLNMRVTEAINLFESVPKVARMLTTLDDVGLGYVQLGQSAPTLSGGEAQRVKLAAELGRPSTGKTLYILDEPTTGLHFDDLKKLLGVLHRLVDVGNTCICIEHNLDVIKTADWLIDLGPEAGERGGQIVCAAPPEQVAAQPDSHTGRALAPVLAEGPLIERVTHAQAKKRKIEKVVQTVPDLGDDVDMPWVGNGRVWHTVNHVDAKGQPTAWDSKLLIWLVDTIEKVGTFAPTDWSQRSRIEIKAKAAKPWFCHILTGGQDLLDVAIRVPEQTLDADRVATQLNIKTLDERKDLQIYGQWARLRRRTSVEGWEEWRMHLRDFADVKKPPFRRFFTEAANAYAAAVEQVKADPTKTMPWMKDGQQWHLSQRGISQRNPIRWKPAMLMAMLGRFKSIQGDIGFNWSSKTAVQLELSGEIKPVAKIVTNIGRGLRVELRAPSGVVTPAQVDRLGEEPEIKRHPAYDRVVFWMRSLSQIDSKQLQNVWRICRGTEESEQLKSA